MPKEITVDLMPDGTVSAEGSNFVGLECDKVFREIERVLGGKVTTRRMKPERAVRTQEIKQKI